MVCVQLSQHDLRARELWQKIDTMVLDDAAILAESAAIQKDALLSIHIASPVTTWKRLNQHCTEETYIVEANRYAT